MASSVSCKHCGSPVPERREDGFCCAGCLHVHELLLREGLEHFYDLKGQLSLPPVSPQSLRERDYEWLRELAHDAEKELASAPDGAQGTSTTVELKLALQGISCVGCVWLMEKAFSRHAGGIQITVDVIHGELKIIYAAGVFDAVAFAKDLQGFGYLVGPVQEGLERKQSSGLEWRMGVCGAFAMNAMAFSLPAYFGMPGDFAFASWFDMIAAVSATLALLVGGTYFIEKAWQSLRLGTLHIDTPIALGIVAAWLGSMGGWMAGVEGLKYFDFVAIFIFLMLAGRWAQQAAVERNRRKLMRDTSVPESVHVPGQERPQPLSLLKPGVRYYIRPGQSVPVACRLISPQASVSLEWINGESEAQQRSSGQLLPSGALNIGLSRLEGEAVESWQGSTLRRLLEARRAGEYRDLKLERLLRGYLLVVVLAGVGSAGWWLMHGSTLAAALQVMISIFVVSCPCALGVAVPLAEDLAASRAEKLGVFVRSLALWKRLMQERRVIFDKTGTLTLENPVLENPEVLAQLDPEARAALHHLVSGNLHPVSRSLFDALGPVMLEAETETPPEMEEVIGQGVRFTDGAGHVWSLGRGDGGDACLAKDARVLAAFRFRDELRAESVTEVVRLKQRGLAVQILSGDREPKVAHIARRLGLAAADWKAGMTPEEKAAWVAHGQGQDTLFIGDGANDSLAFDQALCAGSPVTGRSFLEQKADFFFLGHSLSFVSGLLDTARLHRRATRRVFAFSVAYNVATVVAGMMGHLSPLAAAVLMPLSSVVTLGLVAWTFSQGKSRSAWQRVAPQKLAEAGI